MRFSRGSVGSKIVDVQVTGREGDNGRLISLAFAPHKIGTYFAGVRRILARAHLNWLRTNHRPGVRGWHAIRWYDHLRG